MSSAVAIRASDDTHVRLIRRNAVTRPGINTIQRTPVRPHHPLSLALGTPAARAHAPGSSARLADENSAVLRISSQTTPHAGGHSVDEVAVLPHHLLPLTQHADAAHHPPRPAARGAHLYRLLRPS